MLSEDFVLLLNFMQLFRELFNYFLLRNVFRFGNTTSTKGGGISRRINLTRSAKILGNCGHILESWGHRRKLQLIIIIIFFLNLVAAWSLVLILALCLFRTEVWEDSWGQRWRRYLLKHPPRFHRKIVISNSGSHGSQLWLNGNTLRFLA